MNSTYVPYPTQWSPRLIPFIDDVGYSLHDSRLMTDMVLKLKALRTNNGGAQAHSPPYSGWVGFAAWYFAICDNMLAASATSLGTPLTESRFVGSP